MELPSFPGICERDIDLLLLEELWATPAFGAWLIDRCAADGEVLQRVTEVKKSVTQSSGESDLELTWQRNDGTFAKLLIENKVDAGFQRDQAARYHQRSQDYVANGICVSVWTVVLAPAAYFQADRGSYGFDAAVTYQELQEWYRSAALGKRAEYKVGMLDAAIRKATLGYNPIPDDAVSQFWRAYWDLSLSEAPELGMAQPDMKPAGSTWIYFAPDGLPSNVWLIHKLPRGSVELTIGGAGYRLGKSRMMLQAVLELGMTIDRAGKSISVRLNVPALNIAQDMNEQRDAAIAGMAAAKRLLSWAQTHAELLQVAAQPD